MRFWNFVISIIAVGLSVEALGADSCEFYKMHAPGIYKIVCGGSKSSRSASTFSNSFHTNPSGLPTDVTPYGLEAINHVLKSDLTAYDYDLAIIKGFRRIGAGISTGGNRTFYGNDLLQRAQRTPELQTLQPIEEAKSKIPSVTLGTSIAISKHGIKPTLGMLTRYNRITGTLGYGGGISFRPSIFSFGIGTTRERISKSLPQISFYTLTAGAKFSILEYEYLLMMNDGGYKLSPVRIHSVTLLLGRLMISGATRNLEYFGYGQVTQKHFAIQMQISQKWSAGYLYNYIPGAYSVAIQHLF